jgi:uncharacterized protein (TIGR02996 family)
MTTDEDFLAAILANPADDHIRLFFADHLEETGREERAEFIRVQCELARLGQDEVSPEQLRVTGEVGRLARRQREIWNMPKAGYWWGSDCYVSLGRSLFDRALTPQNGKAAGLVRRGFVAEIRLPIAAFSGKTCERCGGTGRLRFYHNVEIELVEDCDQCDGDGQLVVALFVQHPINRTIVTDREPLATGSGGSDLFTWYEADFWDSRVETGRENNLPRDVFNRLTGSISQSMTYRSYRKKGDAASALSAALVAIGRERAAEKKAQPQGAA